MNNKFYLNDEILKATSFSYEGKFYDFKTPEELREKLIELSKEEGKENIVTAFCNSYRDGKVVIGKKFFKQNKPATFEDIKNMKTYPKNTLKKRIAAMAMAAFVAVSAIGIVGCEKAPTPAENSTENVKDMDFDQLLLLLNEGTQRDTFKLMDKVQNNFNNKLAPSIKVNEDKNAQLYLKAEEIIALYTYANAESNTNEFSKIFGNSGLLRESKLEKNHTEAAQNLVKYYLRGTEKSGMSELFTDKDNKKLVEQAETLYFNAKKNPTTENKKAFNSFIDGMFLSGKSDDLKTTSPEAAGYIATIIVPAAEQLYITNNSLQNKIEKINGTIICNELGQYIEDIIEDCKATIQVEKDNEKIELHNEVVAQMPYAMDEKNIKVESREINLSKDVRIKTQKGVNLSNIASKVLTSKTTKKITKKEAEKQFGKDKVKEVEEKADKDKGIDEANAKEQVRAKGIDKGLSIGYAYAYNDIYSGKSVTVATYESQIQSELAKYTEKYKSKYETGIRQGIAESIRIIKEQYKNDQAKIEEAKNKNYGEEIEETYSDKVEYEYVEANSYNEESSMQRTR